MKPQGNSTGGRRFKPYPAYKDSGVEWLGEIPAHWDVAPVYARYEVALGKMLDAKRVTGEFSGRYLRNVDVQWDRVDTEELPEMDFAPWERDRYLVRPGDLLVCEGGEVGRAAIWRGEIKECFYQKALHRLRPRAESEAPRFFYYLMYLAATRGVFAAGGNQDTIDHLTAIQLRHYRLPFAPMYEQRAIAAFLDRETARIDALVAKKERLIELLQEKRTALITRAVTKGLDPNVPMKDSGVEWLGEIPAHWEVERIKWAARMKSGHTPDKKVDSYWHGGDIPWVSLADTGSLREVDYIANTAVMTTPDGLAHSSAHILPAGTVVFSRDATIGLCAITRASMAVSQHFIGWVCSVRLNPEYLLFVLRSMTEELERLTMGATVRTIGMPDVRSLVTPIPPVPEQERIVLHVHKNRSEIDALVGKVREAIERLRELRTALISAAVTGRIDVRGAAAGSAGVAETGGSGR
jgi:type I restriction enzyme S subunit